MNESFGVKTRSAERDFLDKVRNSPKRAPKYPSYYSNIEPRNMKTQDAVKDVFD